MFPLLAEKVIYVDTFVDHFTPTSCPESFTWISTISAVLKLLHVFASKVYFVKLYKEQCICKVFFTGSCAWLKPNSRQQRNLEMKRLELKCCQTPPESTASPTLQNLTYWPIWCPTRYTMKSTLCNRSDNLQCGGVGKWSKVQQSATNFNF